MRQLISMVNIRVMFNNILVFSIVLFPFYMGGATSNNQCTCASESEILF